MSDQAFTDAELQAVEDDSPLVSEYDLLFPVVPLEDDPAANEQGLYALVDDLDDFALDSRGPLEPDEQEMGGSVDYAFDWDYGEFYIDESGQPLRVSDADAVVEWALKALNTPRGVYAIYSSAYGSTLQEIIGLGLPDAIAHALISEAITTCLAQHPQITDVGIDGIMRAPSVGNGTYLVSISLYLDDDDDGISIEVAA